MQIFGFVLAVVAFLVALFFALGFNEFDVERAKEYRERGAIRTDLWTMTCVGLALVWIVPLVPLVFMTNVDKHVNLFTWGSAAVWTVFVVLSFVLARRFIFRVLMKRIDNRRKK